MLIDIQIRGGNVFKLVLNNIKMFNRFTFGFDGKTTSLQTLKKLISYAYRPYGNRSSLHGAFCYY
jgi:hypothetical protein